MRSLLFVPGDDETKLAKALTCGADALIIDLEDAVSPDNKERARRVAADFLHAQANRPDLPELLVRVNSWASGLLSDDLAAIVPGAPSGIMLPKAESGADVIRLADALDALEMRHGVTLRASILPIVTETATAMFNLGSYRGAAPQRLSGMLWGGEDLAADIGASVNRDTSGAYLPPFQMARAGCLFAAASAGVAAIDAVYTDFRDLDGLEAEARMAVRDGFAAKAAIHPAQVPVINAAFTPDAAQLDWARAVIAAFAAQPGAGVVALDGRMLDRPHLRQAQRLLERARS